MNFSDFFSSLRVKLPLRILCLVVLVFSLSIAITLVIFDSIIDALKDDHAESAAQAVTANVNIQIRQAKHDLQVIATLPTVNSAMENLPETHKVADFQRMHPKLGEILLKIQNAYGFYRNLFIVNQYGEYIVGTKQLLLNKSAEDERQAIEKMIHIEEVNLGEVIRNPNTKQLLLPMYLRLEHANNVGGVVATLQIDEILNRAMRDTTHDEIHTIPIIARIGGMDTVNSINDQILPLGTHEISSNVLENERGVMHVTHAGEKLTIGFSQISGTSIYILAVVDSTFKYNYINMIRNSMIGVSIVAAFIILLMVYLFVRPVTRDIARISVYAKNITKGSTENSIFLDRNDEIGSLSQSLEQMVYSLKEMISRSEAATKAKSDFLARMSHEIRTPMNGIIGMTYLALSANPDEKQKQYLDRIDGAAKSLLNIINDILDFSKIEANKMDMLYSNVSLQALISSLQDVYLPQCAEKHLTLSCSIDDNVPKNIKTDALRLMQICSYLCSNALKFTMHGYISLQVSLANIHKYEKGHEFELLFTIKDTGIGMSMAEQEIIFDAFTQADGTHTRKYGGTGLGLTISKKLVNLLGGSITVDSKKGVGSSFSFTIRTIEGDLMENSGSDLQALEEQNLAPLVPLDILLVEDNEINQMIAIEILEEMGAQVTLAQNGVEAVNTWESGEFDLILMDIQMPLMDGLTAAKHIRTSSCPRSKTVPILAMTAHAMTGDREKSLGAGMNDHITKPIDVNQLRSAISFWGNSSKAEVRNQ